MYFKITIKNNNNKKTPTNMFEFTCIFYICIKQKKKNNLEKRNTTLFPLYTT